MDADYPDVVYFPKVRWLSRAKTFKRFWNLRGEIELFLANKDQDVDFLSYDNWLNDLAFLFDITGHLSELNVKLQGKNQLVHEMFSHITSFQNKLQLFGTHLYQS